jgi:hypothetical protein
MSRNILFRFIFCLITWHALLLNHSYAQIGNTNYPISITPVLFPPFPSSVQFLSNAQTPSLYLTITNKSSNASVQNILLAVSIRTSTFNAQTRTLNNAVPFTLIGNTPLQLTNVDFSSLYNFSNLIGLTQAQYSSAFAQSTITFGFVVYDAVTRVQLSNVNTYQVTYAQNNPPTLQLPNDRASIVEQGVQNIAFQWIPRQSNAPGSVEYRLQLIQVVDTTINAQQYFAGTPRLLFEGTTTATNFVYNALHPPLVTNQTYAWRVQARPVDYGGFTSTTFLEGGNSPVRTFKYVEPCRIPTVSSVTNTTNNATISWTASTPGQTFIVSYKPQNQLQWIDMAVPRINMSNSIVVPNLNQSTAYNIKVKGVCYGGAVVESAVSNFSTTTDSTVVTTPATTTPATTTSSTIRASCGAIPTRVALADTRIATLAVNDRIMAGDFEIILTEVSGSNGNFNGSGVADVWINNKIIKVNVSFNSITVNQDKKVTAGEIKTTN